MGGNLLLKREFDSIVSIRKLFAISLFFLTAVSGCRSVSVPTSVPSPAVSGEADLLRAVSGSSEAGLEPTWNGKGSLRDYYLRGKYPQVEIDAVANMVAKVFPNRSKEQKNQMVAEILSFEYVVYHTTDNHDLGRNHSTIRRYQELLKTLCDRHGVPFYPVLAITSWENSGGADKVSWADAAGLGQMTWGAVDEAHRYAARKAADLKEQAQWERYQAAVDKDSSRITRAQKLEAQAAKLDLESRHRRMAKKAGVSDERAIAECNLEDVVLFFDFLLDLYGGRVDQAIGAYHKGALNQDDIVYDYLRRRDASVMYPQPSDRSSFLAGLARLDLSYLDLWNDPRSREMLNGLRTVEGEVTTASNAHLALGDESDIYPWKVLGSLSGLLAGEAYLHKMIERYQAPQLAVEVSGLPAYLGAEGEKRGKDEGWLVRIPTEWWPGKTDEERAYWVRSEMIGYLQHLQDRVSRLSGRLVLLPIIELGEAREGSQDWEKELAAKGVSVRLSLQGLTPEQRKGIDAELRRDYLFDRIYLRSTKDERHIVLNPRFGHEFQKMYEARVGVRRES